MKISKSNKKNNNFKIKIVNQIKNYQKLIYSKIKKSSSCKLICNKKRNSN